MPAAGWGFWQVPLGRIGPSVGFGALNAVRGLAESDAALLSSGLFAGSTGRRLAQHAGFLLC